MSEPSGLTVVGLQVDSYQRLRAARLHPSPTGLVPVYGNNEAGKSSLLESMLELLGARKMSDMPIREGEDGASTVMDLGEIVVRGRWSKDSGGKPKRTVTVEAADGSKVRSPAAVLESLRGQFADPIAFQSMKPAEQVRTVLAVTGLDQRLDELEAEAEAIYERRRDAGRDAERAEAAAEELRQRVQALPPPAIEDGATLESLTEQLEAAKNHNAAADGAHAAVATIKQRGTDLGVRCDQLRKQIADLQAQLATNEAALEEARTAYVAAAQRATSMKLVDVAPIRERMRLHEAERGNEALRENARLALEHASGLRASHTATDEELAAKRAEIAELLGAAKFPVEGMSYDPEEKRLLVNGIPFTQASQAQRLRIAAAIAMAGNPRIKVLFAREGSLLAPSAQRVLAEVAQEAGWQLWLEVVAESPQGVGVWIEDGVAIDWKGPGAEALSASQEARG